MAAEGHAAVRCCVHDFPTDAEGKAIPYGVYDMARNEAWVSVGLRPRHAGLRGGLDSPLVASRWVAAGLPQRHDAVHHGRCGREQRVSVPRLEARAATQFADQTRLTIQVSHFPPGTSKWNKIEHRLFCHITANWRGTPLTTYETIVDRIGNVRTTTGLRVRAELDAGEYPTGVTVTKEQMDALALVRDAFHGEWNYKLLPR